MDAFRRTPNPRVLPSVKPGARKNRNCLNCRRVFLSDGHGNRLCDNCRQFARHNDAPMTLGYDSGRR